MDFSQAIDLKGGIYKLASKPFHLNITNIILLILLSFSVTSHASLFEIPQGFTSQNLNPVIEYIEDKEHTLNLQQAKKATWQPIEGDGFSKGFSDSQYWFRFHLANKADKTQDYILEVTHPFLDTLDITYEKNGQIVLSDQLGDQLANNSRRLKHSNALSGFSLQAGEVASVYIRVKSKSTLQLPITLWEKDAYIENNHQNSVFTGVMLGIILAICIYHLLIYFSVFEPVYLHFGLFMLASFIIFACLTGLPSFFLWPNQKAEVDNVLLGGLFMSAIFSCYFARHVIDARLRAPRINRLLSISTAVSIIGVICTPFLPYASLLKLTFLLGVINAVLMVIGFIIASLQRYKPAYYALAATTVAGLGGCITILDKIGVMPNTILNAKAAYIGYTLMTLIQAFAISYRIKVAHDDHEQAQEELLTAQKSLTSDLDKKVRQRTEELEKANKRLLELSTVDGLTGIRNRRYFDEALVREYATAFRNKQPIGILVLDIDHFKSVNDTYGHAFGDICLKDIGSILESSVRRPPDIVSRYGGEEFVVLLPNTDLEGTIHLASVIRDKVKAHIFKDEQNEIHLTASIGAFSTIPESHDGAWDMFEQTDQLLYKAKKHGRDRICSNAGSSAE